MALEKNVDIEKHEWKINNRSGMKSWVHQRNNKFITDTAANSMKLVMNTQNWET